MHTILGAGGTIGNELVKELTRKGKQVRLVGRVMLGERPERARGQNRTVG